MLYLVLLSLFLPTLIGVSKAPTTGNRINVQKTSMDTVP